MQDPTELIKNLLAEARVFDNENKNNDETLSEYFKTRNSAMATAFRSAARITALHFGITIGPEMHCESAIIQSSP